MNIEALVSQMMEINVSARLWHWTTDTAQHHVTYEQFLTQNETFTDSLVESSLGNEKKINFLEVQVRPESKTYSLDDATAKLKSYREEIYKAKQFFEERNEQGDAELITILDDVTELTSKTLYLLKLK